MASADAPAAQRRDGRRPSAALVGSLVILVTGLAYSFCWQAVLGHQWAWSTPSDLWTSFRAAQYVSWGGLAQIYNNPAAYQTFPALAVALSPLAYLCDHLHLTSAYPVDLGRPSAWCLLGPVDLVLGSLVLFPLERLMRRLGAPRHRRYLVVGLTTALVWLLVAYWGHPEDSVALALGLGALLAGDDGRWLRMALLLGVGVAFQPLIILIAPLAISRVPPRHWPAAAGTVLAPSTLLLLVPLARQWRATTHRLWHQPNYLPLNHPTPWLRLAPVLVPAHWRRIQVSHYVTLPHGAHRLVQTEITVFDPNVVAAGPGRLVAVAVSFALGVLAWRRRPTLAGIVWLAGIALALRCVVEPVMVPYYLVPGTVLLVAVSSSSSIRRFVLSAIAVTLVSWLSYWHATPWPYYVMMLALLVLAAMASRPRHRDVSSAADVASP